MPRKGPHISISPDFVVNRILRINLEDFVDWPEAVRHLAIEIAEELFLVAYNPFIDAQMVKASVKARFDGESFALAHHYATSIGEGITMFWSAQEAEFAFRDELIRRLADFLPADAIMSNPMALVSNATDATDLRMELPLLVVEPDNAAQVSALVRLANEMKFAIIPRGGGSGLTGGAVPARKRTVMAGMVRLTKISPLDLENKSLTCEAGVITQNAINAAAASGLLLTVDPASKTASTIGGNVAENSGGPFAFEYGTTLDNLLAWRMVTPTGEIITIERVQHPRHKILESEEAVFEVKDLSGGVRNVVTLRGDEIRLHGLGKDVTNKVLGGLPGMQKEGVDGIITEATFVLHPRPEHSRVLILEFFGRSMHHAATVIRDIVEYRDEIRRQGDYASISSLEEFNAKYVQAIEYKRKSPNHEGDPISVILLQIDGDEPFLLDNCVQHIVDMVASHDDVAVMVAKDEKEAELFWEDRHKLSAIAKRTSGFKINEDVVIPMDRIPDFALFLEQLNLECAASGYRTALQEVGRLQGMPLEDKEFNREFSWASKAAKGDVSAADMSDIEVRLRAVIFLESLCSSYPHLTKRIARIKEYMVESRIEVASHMHAGDGNCHVNIPVNSNDPIMLELAEHAAVRVMGTAQEMGGEVSGEHGIGITKIAFLSKEKMDALRAFKERVDPRDIMNPAKLTQPELPVRPFTFSFNRLIEDIHQSGLPDKQRLINLLSAVQVCTRCGKCKQVCAMYYPERAMQYFPRNKNIVLGVLVEAIYYSQVNKGKPDAQLLGELRAMMEFCTGCGRCATVCPVKIPSAEAALSTRAFVGAEGAGGHPIKSRALHVLAQKTERRIPIAAKLASMGQNMQNKVLGIIPRVWQKQMQNPLFSGKGPVTGYHNLYESIRSDKGCVFAPSTSASTASAEAPHPAVLYFPGCGGALFHKDIGLASLFLLLSTGVTVILPEKHLCCGYPALSAGEDGLFRENAAHNITAFSALLTKAQEQNLTVTHLLTACGTCRDALERSYAGLLPASIQQMDVVQFLSTRLPATLALQGQRFVYHPACHTEWVGVHKIKAAGIYAAALAALTGASVQPQPGCCGESGMGAMTSPHIYNELRARKAKNLMPVLATCDPQSPVLVGCPSCRIGIARILLAQHDRRPVLHSTEWLAQSILGAQWKHILRKKLADSQGGVVRLVDM